MKTLSEALFSRKNINKSNSYELTVKNETLRVFKENNRIVFRLIDEYNEEYLWISTNEDQIDYIITCLEKKDDNDVFLSYGNDTEMYFFVSYKGLEICFESDGGRKGNDILLNKNNIEELIEFLRENI